MNGIKQYLREIWWEGLIICISLLLAQGVIGMWLLPAMGVR